MSIHNGGIMLVELEIFTVMLNQKGNEKSNRFVKGYEKVTKK